MQPRNDDRRIELTVQRDGDSFRGRATDPVGETREFTGWLGLLGALEAFLGGPETTPIATTTEEP